MAWLGKTSAALWVAVGASMVFGQAAKPSTASRTLVRAGHLLDVKTGKVLDAQTIVVSGETISSVGATSTVPAQAGDTVVDLGE